MTQDDAPRTTDKVEERRIHATLDRIETMVAHINRRLDELGYPPARGTKA